MSTRKGIGYTEGTNMPVDGNGSNISERMDRVEKIVEILANTQLDMQQDLKILLRSQVVMGETLTEVIKAQKRTEEHLQRLEESLRHTDERMSALILTVDEIIRNPRRE
jgi:hypothetical protein